MATTTSRTDAVIGRLEEAKATFVEKAREFAATLPGDAPGVKAVQVIGFVMLHLDASLAAAGLRPEEAKELMPALMDFCGDVVRLAA